MKFNKIFVGDKVVLNTLADATVFTVVSSNFPIVSMSTTNVSGRVSYYDFDYTLLLPASTAQLTANII